MHACNVLKSVLRPRRDLFSADAFWGAGEESLDPLTPPVPESYIGS